MAAEALIVEDAYQRGYADAIADMRKKKEQRRQREQAKKARRWYFIKQKAYGLAMLAVTVLAAWATEGDITIAVITVPLGLMCLFSKKMLIVHGKGGEAGIKAIQQLAGMVDSLKQCQTPQEVYDRYLQITGYCKCCVDCNFIDQKGADELMCLAAYLAGNEQARAEAQQKAGKKA